LEVGVEGQQDTPQVESKSIKNDSEIRKPDAGNRKNKFVFGLSVKRKPGKSIKQSFKTSWHRLKAFPAVPKSLRVHHPSGERLFSLLAIQSPKS
jgi:hypothetical protein